MHFVRWNAFAHFKSERSKLIAVNQAIYAKVNESPVINFPCCFIQKDSIHSVSSNLADFAFQVIVVS